jgi:cytochrome P450
LSNSTRDRAETAFQTLFFTTEGRTDPYPCYATLRELAPVHRSDIGMWVLSRYDDCWAALRDPRFGKEYESSIERRVGADWRDHPSAERGRHSMINLTGAPHTRLRKRVSSRFTPRRIGAVAGSIEGLVTELLDPLVEAGRGDILDALGFPLPIAVIGELLGVPAADRPAFRALVTDFVGILEMRPTREQVETADRATLEIHSYFADLIAERRSNPTDDLLSELTNDGPEGDPLSVDELVSLATLLFAAGFETTTNLVGNGLWALLQNPEQMEILRRRPELFETLSEELLRYDGSVHMASRYTEVDVEVGGVVIPRGETVFALLGSGNRDPEVFDNPDQLDVTRTDVKPLTFGGGVHFCVGAHLARLEIGVVMRQLFERFETLELDGPRPTYQDRLTLRGLTGLGIRGRARTSAAASAASAASASASASASTPAAQEAAPATGAEQARSAPRPTRGLRPSADDAAGDLRWRAELRAGLEAQDAGTRTMLGGNRDDVVALLRSHSLFARSTDAELRQLAATAFPISFDPGDMLTVEGAESPECYIIEEGEALVTIGRKGVGRLGQEAIVGERGVLLETSRAATVTAISHMVAYSIASDRLRALAAANPEARTWMLEDMRRRYPNLDN